MLSIETKKELHSLRDDHIKKDDRESTLLVDAITVVLDDDFEKFDEMMQRLNYEKQIDELQESVRDTERLWRYERSRKKHWKDRALKAEAFLMEGAA